MANVLNFYVQVDDVSFRNTASENFTYVSKTIAQVIIENPPLKLSLKDVLSSVR